MQRRPKTCVRELLPARTAGGRSGGRPRTSKKKTQPLERTLAILIQVRARETSVLFEEVKVFPSMPGSRMKEADQSSRGDDVRRAYNVGHTWNKLSRVLHADKSYRRSQHSCTHHSLGIRSLLPGCWRQSMRGNKVVVEMKNDTEISGVLEETDRNMKWVNAPHKSMRSVGHVIYACRRLRKPWQLRMPAVVQGHSSLFSEKRFPIAVMNLVRVRHSCLGGNLGECRFARGSNPT